MLLETKTFHEYSSTQPLFFDLEYSRARLQHQAVISIKTAAAVNANYRVCFFPLWLSMITEMIYLRVIKFYPVFAYV